MGLSVESLDTNVLLHIILGDVPAQRQRALRLLRREGVRYRVSDWVLAEAVFVLERERLPREEIASDLQRVLDALEIEYSQELFANVFAAYLAHPKLSFDDCYLAAEAAQAQAEPLWTFDHKLAVQDGTAKEVG